MHTQERALLMRLITPKRLKENEAFMWRLADQQLDEFVADGRCEFIGAYAQPFAMLVVADLLGVPEADHRRFREGFGLSAAPGEVGAGPQGDVGLNPLGWLDDWFAEYVEDRRRAPRHDVLTDLALATYPDGTTPDVIAVVRTATFLFAAGQETTARLLAARCRYLAEQPELQDELRAHHERIPGLPRGGAPRGEPGEDRLPPHPPRDDDRRRRHRGRHAGDAAQRRRQPRSRGASSARRSSASTAPTRRRTSRSGAATTRARVVRWRAPRGGSASNASSTACTTSGSPTSTTARRTTRHFAVHADLGAARPRPAAPRVHAGDPRRS